MSQIKGKNTKPELLVRKFIHSLGFRFRLHKKDLPGKPDIVLQKLRTVIFVNGCFWHKHENCRYCVIPKTRTKWWTEKLTKNQTNDQRAISALENEGWKTITIWECQLRKNTLEQTLKQLRKKLLRISKSQTSTKRSVAKPDSTK